MYKSICFEEKMLLTDHKIIRSKFETSQLQYINIRCFWGWWIKLSSREWNVKRGVSRVWHFTLGMTIWSITLRSIWYLFYNTEQFFLLYYTEQNLVPIFRFSDVSRLIFWCITRAGWHIEMSHMCNVILYWQNTWSVTVRYNNKTYRANKTF